MPAEVWLRPNRRPAMVVMNASVAVVAVSLAAMIMAVLGGREGGRVTTVAVLAASVAGIACLVAFFAYYSSRRPRIYREGSQLFFRIGPRPISAPLGVVEAFFLGQGPAHLPGGMGERLETINLVARLAERATDWHHRETDRRLGEWCGGYITVRGTCCEPLTVEVVHRLNRSLTAAKREAADRA